MVKTLHFHCRRHRFDPLVGGTRILHATWAAKKKKKGTGTPLSSTWPLSLCACPSDSLVFLESSGDHLSPLSHGEKSKTCGELFRPGLEVRSVTWPSLDAKGWAVCLCAQMENSPTWLCPFSEMLPITSLSRSALFSLVMIPYFLYTLSLNNLFASLLTMFFPQAQSYVKTEIVLFYHDHVHSTWQHCPAE